MYPCLFTGPVISAPLVIVDYLATYHPCSRSLKTETLGKSQPLSFWKDNAGSSRKMNGRAKEEVTK